jgi:dephospho-CoA kinase
MVVGVTGRNGAGKGAVVEFLSKFCGFRHFSARAYIAETLASEGLEPTRKNLRRKGNALREAFGRSHVADALLERMLEATSGKTSLSVLESVRHPDEVASLRDKAAVGERTNAGSENGEGFQFLLLAVSTRPRTRYERMVLRKSPTDAGLDYATFLLDDALEENGEGGNASLRATLALADMTITNNGTIEDLRRRLRGVLGGLEGVECV